MRTPSKSEPLVDINWQRTVTTIFGNGEKKMYVTGTGLPSDGNSLNPEPEVREYVQKHLTKPILDTLAKYMERPGAPTPKVILEFVPQASAEVATNSSREQVQEQTIPVGQIDPRSLIKEPECSLDRVILPIETKKQVEQILTLGTKIGLIKQWGFDSISGAIVLVGPAGSGKTSCAHGIAHALGKKIMVVNFGQMQSRYVAQTDENIRHIFAHAKLHNVLLFIDEADGALGTRLSKVEDAADQGLNTARNTILVEMEKFEGILILATNNVHTFDPAAADRLLDCIPFTLPDADCRLRIFKTHLPLQFPLGDDVSLERLAELTDGLSGRGIKNVVKKLVLKTATQNCPTNEMRATMKEFVESIEEVRQGQNAILGNREPQKPSWMSTKIEEMVNGNNQNESNSLQNVV